MYVSLPYKVPNVKVHCIASQFYASFLFIYFMSVCVCVDDAISVPMPLVQHSVKVYESLSLKSRDAPVLMKVKMTVIN